MMTNVNKEQSLTAINITVFIPSLFLIVIRFILRAVSFIYIEQVIRLPVRIVSTRATSRRIDCNGLCARSTPSYPCVYTKREIFIEGG